MSDERSAEPNALVHVIGIGGVGMNAVAQAYCAMGYAVTGSDRLLDQGQRTDVLDKLSHAGVTLFPQDGSGIQEGTRAVIVSSAIEPDNPDLLVARERGIAVWHRAEALAKLVGDAHLIAVAGTSGKTTVTGMIGWLLTQLGLRPNVVNGGELLNWQQPDRIGSVQITGSDWWVLEVDESDRSLLHFYPDWAVLTNISADHFSLKDSVELFETFAAKVSIGLITGDQIANFDLTHTDSQAKQFRVSVGSNLTLPIHLPGLHNRENAALAIALCEAMGFERTECLEHLSNFQGVARRLQLVGNVNDVLVYDDYAHNPAKIRAAWTAVRAAGRRVLGVWRPHGYGPLKAMMTELVEMFASTVQADDHLYIMPVYYAGGTADRSMDGDELVTRLQARGLAASYMADYESLKKELEQTKRAGDVILCMGARDPDLPKFARRLT